MCSSPNHSNYQHMAELFQLYVYHIPELFCMKSPCMISFISILIRICKRKGPSLKLSLSYLKSCQFLILTSKSPKLSRFYKRERERVCVCMFFNTVGFFKLADKCVLQSVGFLFFFLKFFLKKHLHCIEYLPFWICRSILAVIFKFFMPEFLLNWSYFQRLDLTQVFVLGKQNGRANKDTSNMLKSTVQVLHGN